MHAAGALLIVDLEFAVFIFHAFGGAAVNDFLDDVEFTPVAAGMGPGVGGEIAVHISSHRVLIDADVVFPGADKGDVGPGDGGHAAVGASVKFKFEFIRECRTMQLILIFIGQGMAEVLGVVAGKFAAGSADAVSGRPQVGTRSAKVLIVFVGQFKENFLKLRRGGAQEDDVAGGAVHVGQAGTPEFPKVAEISEIRGGIIFTRRLGHAHGMEMGHARKFFRLVAVTTDNAAAVTKHAHDAAVFPMGLAVLKRQFENTQKVFNDIHRDLELDFFLVFCPCCGILLQIVHEARPRSAYKLIQQGGFMFRHRLPPFH